MKQVLSFLIFFICFSLDASASFLNGSLNHPISVSADVNPKTTKAVIFVHGTGETQLRYLEISKFFKENRFNTYRYDQRGHGYSGRFTKDRTKVSTDSFANQIKDLDKIVKIAKSQNNKVYLLGHSMGGLIITRYLQINPDDVDAAVVSSPMYKIKLPTHEDIVSIFINAQIMFGMGKVRVLTEDPNFPKTASHLEIKETHSRKMHENYKSIVKKDPDNLFTWGVTNHWLMEAIKTGKATRENVSNLKTPLLVLSAGDDHFVDQKAQKIFCDSSKLCKNKVYPHSFHSIFQEEKYIREDAYKASLEFFKETSKQNTL